MTTNKDLTTERYIVELPNGYYGYLETEQNWDEAYMFFTLKFLHEKMEEEGILTYKVCEITRKEMTNETHNI